MNRNNNVITPPQTNKRNVFVAVGIVLVMAAVVGLGLWWWITAKSDFEKLQGKWVRTDGGYVLEIKQVAGDGKIDAAYLNPNSINVSIAHVSPEAGKMNVFVELRDRGYPGNYYKLTYDASKDQLSGVYYHVGIGQQFDVFFERIK